MTNCPNCNAPVHGGECEYCGTSFERLPQAETYVVQVHGYVDNARAEHIRNEFARQLEGAKCVVCDDSVSIRPMVPETYGTVKR